MEKTLKITLAAFLAALTLSAATIMPANAQGACLDNRGIQSAIAAGQIVPLANALANNGVDASQEVLSVQVCDQGGGRFVYVVAVLNAQGQAENLTLSAN